ncbi:hypothetical protein SEUCBS139899_000427 [Sporothrix eucalyptigena]
MAPSDISPEPQYVEFSHDGAWGHKREIPRGSRAKPTFEELPVIDMSGSFSDNPETRLRVAQDIARACEQVGFFYVVNHGIPQQLMDDTVDAARKYFEKPLEDKMKDHIQEQRPPGLRARARRQHRKESFLHNYEPSCDPVPPTLTEAQRALLHQTLWPEGDSRFKDACFRYDSRMMVLMRKMVQMFVLGLGLDEHHFDYKVTHSLASCKKIH